MDSLDLLIQANNHTQTLSYDLTDGFLGLTQPSQHKDALHSKIQLLGMKEKHSSTKNKLIKWEKTPWEQKTISTNILGHYRGKNSLPEHPKRGSLLAIH